MPGRRARMAESFRVETRGIPEALRALNPQLFVKAKGDAMNRAMRKAGTDLKRAVTDKYTLKSARAKEGFEIRTQPITQEGGRLIRIRSAYYALSRKNFTQKAGIKQTRDGARIRLKKAGGFKVLSGKFVVNQWDNKVLERKRAGAGARVGRGPLTSIATIPLSNMVGSRDVVVRAQQVIDRDLPGIFAARYRNFLSRI